MGTGELCGSGKVSEGLFQGHISIGKVPKVLLNWGLPLNLQPYPRKVVRPPKPTPTIFSGGGWSPRVQ